MLTLIAVVLVIIGCLLIALVSSKKEVRKFFALSKPGLWRICGCFACYLGSLFYLASPGGQTFIHSGPDGITSEAFGILGYSMLWLLITIVGVGLALRLWEKLFERLHQTEDEGRVLA